MPLTDRSAPTAHRAAHLLADEKKNEELPSPLAAANDIKEESGERRKQISTILRSLLSPTKLLRQRKRPRLLLQAVVLSLVVAWVSLTTLELSPSRFDAMRHNKSSGRRRPSCQIVYVVGAEGAAHHGFLPVLRTLAEAQPNTAVEVWNGAVRRIMMAVRFPRLARLFLLKRTLRRHCPPDRHTVFLEELSYPCGKDFRKRWHRNETASEVAASLERRPHPVDLLRFPRTFAPYADVKFLVLHRNFVHTVISHGGWDGGPRPHAEIIAGQMLYLGQVMGATATPWTLVCVDRLTDATVKRENDTSIRPRLLRHLAEVLEWPVSNCPHCFGNWTDSRKRHDRWAAPHLDMLREKRDLVSRVWPPVPPRSIAGVNDPGSCPP